MACNTAMKQSRGGRKGVSEGVNEATRYSPAVRGTDRTYLVLSTENAETRSKVGDYSSHTWKAYCDSRLRQFAHSR